MNIRLITDENISWRIKKLIPQWTILPANEIKRGQRLSDLLIWRFAKENDYTILTFDEDFSELQNLFSFPPKIIWLRTGNVSTKEICDRLISLEKEIVSFQLNGEIGIYEVYL
jgi:predicted nuclease of predicted toxin-antitoxin system